MANALRKRFEEMPIIIEDREAKATFWQRRIRRLGLVTVLGQLGFGLYAKCWRIWRRGRERDIAAGYALDDSPTTSNITHVRSVNATPAIEILLKMNPKVVVLSQTRILSRQLLESVPAVFINVHTGVTPYYRGHFGAYWALVRGDKANCGVTVHIVDAGIDTGAIVAQARISPSPVDNCFTYHWAQLSAALPLLIEAIESALSGQLRASRPASDKQFPPYSHPTLWSYFWIGISRGRW